MKTSRKRSISLQKRDISLLVGLFECRLMTIDHVATLHFENKYAYAKKRVQKLKAAGMVGERTRNANEKSLLLLTRQGHRFLKNQGQLSNYPPLSNDASDTRANVSVRRLPHELDVMDVRAALHGALAQFKRFSINIFWTWPLLYQFETPMSGYGSDILVQPDGFLSILETEVGTAGFAHDFFLEVDRSSKTLDALGLQARRYVEYYKSGGYAARNGAPRDQFRNYPFRLLVVLKSAERRNNLAELLAFNNPPVLTQVLLSTLQEVKNDPLGAVWVQPKDFRETIQETTFVHAGSTPSFGYRRQHERDSFVEQNVKKVKLLDD